MPECLVSFGSNLGDRQETIKKAVSLFAQATKAKDIKLSRLTETTPIGGAAGQASFLNGVARFDSDLSAHEIFEAITSVEQQLGRKRTRRWAARTLDIDLLAYGEQVLRGAELTIPHPRMSFRPFVLKPACEVAPDWVHPELGVTLNFLEHLLEQGREAVVTSQRLLPLVKVEVELRSLELAVETFDSRSRCNQQPKLVIDTVPSSQSSHKIPSPTLSLGNSADLSWRTEVQAALECVWPMCENRGSI